MATDEELTRIHERLDDLFMANGATKSVIERMEERCVGCRKLVDHHQEALHGNGKPGLIERMGAVETGRTDTLSVKSMIAILGAVGTLAATIGAAMGAFVK